MEKKRKLNFDSDIYNTIRKNIKKYRKLKGITAIELSKWLIYHRGILNSLL